MKYTYLLVLLFTIVVPFLFSFHPRILFDKHFIPFIKASVLASIPFLAWDVFFTETGVWSFNPDYTIGWKIYNLPVEEVLFFICIPFSCMFTIHCFRKFFPVQNRPGREKIIVLLLSSTFLIIGFLFFQALYTAVTFIGTALWLLALHYYFKVKWLNQFLVVYPVLLIPFFIVNGILTGTGLAQPVVSYNDQENLGMRLITIPIEDVVYGFELLLLNFFFYDRFHAGRNQNVSDF